MATDTASDATGSTAGETELGPSPELLAVVGYVFNVVGAVLLLVLEDNDYVRHHAAQSLLFTAVVIAARVALNVLGVVFGLLGLGIVVDLLGLAVWLGAIAGFVFLAYKGYSGERYELPVLGEFIDDVEGMI